MRDWIWEHNRQWQISLPLIAAFVLGAIALTATGNGFEGGACILAAVWAALLPS